MPEAYQKLGRYLLAEEIASGGMAVVYRAKFVGVAGFEKEFAVKKILPHWSDDPEFARMLIDEAKVLVPLHHPNIVQVFELGLDRGTHFIVMELVEGWDLRAVLGRLERRGIGFPFPLLRLIARDLCLGLQYAHERRDANGQALGIVHRDISPQNVMLSREGRVKLTDFGIAKMTGKSVTTRAGVLKGKYAYMSPEQAMGIPLDARSDVFSLGTLLYEMATGRKCFEGENDWATLENVKTATITWPPELDLRLRAVLSRALAKDRIERYRGAGEMRHDLDKMEDEGSRHADAAELARFLAKVMEDERQIGNLAHRNETTRDAPWPETPPERSPPCDVTLMTNATVLHVKTAMELPLPAPRQQKSSHAKQSVHKTHKPRRSSWQVALLCLCSLLLGGASFVFTRQQPHPLGASIAKEAASKMVISASKPRHDFSVTMAAQLGSRQTHKEKPAPLLLVRHQKKLAAQIAHGIGGTFRSSTPRYGTLTVDARPWGTVRIAGQPTRDTPARYRLPTGKYALKVSLPPRKESVTATIAVPRDGMLTCRASFAKTKRLTCFPSGVRPDP